MTLRWFIGMPSLANICQPQSSKFWLFCVHSLDVSEICQSWHTFLIEFILRLTYLLSNLHKMIMEKNARWSRWNCLLWIFSQVKWAVWNNYVGLNHSENNIVPPTQFRVNDFTWWNWFFFHKTFFSVFFSNSTFHLIIVVTKKYQ